MSLNVIATSAAANAVAGWSSTTAKATATTVYKRILPPWEFNLVHRTPGWARAPTGLALGREERRGSPLRWTRSIESTGAPPS